VSCDDGKLLLSTSFPTVKNGNNNDTIAGHYYNKECHQLANMNTESFSKLSFPEIPNLPGIPKYPVLQPRTQKVRGLMCVCELVACPSIINFTTTTITIFLHSMYILFSFSHNL
jgi:hypothetical protein